MLELEPASVGYDVSINFVAALLVALSGGAWATMRRAHRAKELLAERVLGVVRTIAQLADVPLGDVEEEGQRAKFFAEFVSSQMEAELSDSADAISRRQHEKLSRFKTAVGEFIAVRDGAVQRRSKNYWERYNAVVDAASDALKSMGALGRRSRNELADLRRGNRIAAS